MFGLRPNRVPFEGREGVFKVEACVRLEFGGLADRPVFLHLISKLHDCLGKFPSCRGFCHVSCRLGFSGKFEVSVREWDVRAWDNSAKHERGI